MKKSLLFLSFCLIFSVIIANFPNYTNSNIVYAQEDSKYISVVGRAEIEKQADYVEIGFCIQNTANSYNDTQTKINESLETLEQQIKQVDQDAELIISNCQSKPSFAKNNSYTTICNFVIKSKCLDCVDKIIEVASNHNISCFNGIHYILENKQDVLDEVYELARQDADNKAMKISKYAKLIDSNNFKQLRIPFSNTSEKIKVEARVKNLYELINDNYAEMEKELEEAHNNDNSTENQESDQDKNLNIDTNVNSNTSQPKSDSIESNNSDNNVKASENNIQSENQENSTVENQQETNVENIEKEDVK